MRRALSAFLVGLTLFWGGLASATTGVYCVVNSPGTSRAINLYTMTSTVGVAWTPTNNHVYIIGGGGDGYGGSAGVAGGGSGAAAYSEALDLGATGGDGVFKYAVPASGGSTSTSCGGGPCNFNVQIGTTTGSGGTGVNDTYMCGATTSCNAFNAANVIAQAEGGAKTSTNVGTSGGSAASSVCAFRAPATSCNKRSGGSGNTGGTGTGGGGGGGSAGPSSNGINGAIHSTTTGGAGGGANGLAAGAGTGGAAETSGVSGTDLTTLIGNCAGEISGALGTGGGGGGANSTDANSSGAGAKYGGGGGGGYNAGAAGAGGQGIIIFQWNAPTSSKCAVFTASTGAGSC